MIPGRALHRLAKLLLPPGACEKIAEAQLADFQHEWSNASSAPAGALALVRGYLAFGAVFLSCAIGMRALSSEERRALSRVLTIAAAVAVLTTVGLAIFFLLPMRTGFGPDQWREERQFRLVMFVNLANQLFPLAASSGIVCGIAIGLTRHASRASRRVVLIGIAASCIGMFLLTNWGLPLGFRALSRAVRGQASLGQPAAATLDDVRLTMITAEQTPTAGPGTIRSTEVAYYFRYAEPCAIFALGLFALSLIHRGTVVRTTMGIAACVLYFYLVRGMFGVYGWTPHVRPTVLAWLPNLIVVGLSVVIMSVHYRGPRGRTEETVS